MASVCLVSCSAISCSQPTRSTGKVSHHSRSQCSGAEQQLSSRLYRALWLPGTSRPRLCFAGQLITPGPLCEPVHPLTPQREAWHGVAEGAKGVPKVDPSQVTDEVWNHIFLDGPAPQGCSIPAELLQRCKQEFNFWYPFDLRVGPVTTCPSAAEVTCLEWLTIRVAVLFISLPGGSESNRPHAHDLTGVDADTGSPNVDQRVLHTLCMMFEVLSDAVNRFPNWLNILHGLSSGSSARKRQA